MLQFFALGRPLTRIAILFLFVFFAMTGLSSAQTTPEVKPETKVDQLLEILADPAVKDWLAKQSQLPQSAAAKDMELSDVSSVLSTTLTMIKTHGQTVMKAFPRLPAQFERARTILLFEFEEQGVLGILALIAGFIAAGFGFDRLARWALKGYISRMKLIPTTNPHGRLNGLAMRMLYAMLMIAAFAMGSIGMFLFFDWPPLLREIVLAYLTAAIITRIVLMLGRVTLTPPFLGLQNSEKYRVLPMSDARAAHWYVYAGLNTGWFVFVGATLGLLTTFGFDLDGRLAIGIIAGFVQLILVLAAVWLRPPESHETPRRLSPHAKSWMLTVFFVVLWLLRVSGSYTAFWLLLALVALPAAISAAKGAVHHVLRVSEDETEGFPVVTVAVIDRGVRVCLILAAAYFLAKAWGIDVVGMTQGDSTVERLLRGGLNASIIILAADFGWSVTKAFISRRLGVAAPDASDVHSATATPDQARLRTLLPIVQNILFAVIVIIAILMTLSSLGIEIAPLIAGAGVAGVAIGFGAQTLVKDVISGMFYLLDDAFRVGEYVEAGSHKGTVESFSLRSVKLRHHRGYLTTVPFGELGAVQNMSRDWVVDKLSVTVGYDTDIEKARKLIKKLGLELAEDPEFAPHIIEPMKMQGVQNFGDYGIELRLKMMTKPGEQFPIRRRAYVRLKQIFAENGIEIPFPTIHVQGQGSSNDAAAAQAFVAAKAAAKASAT
jgi:moderate conductance mechanosensitive channel